MSYLKQSTAATVKMGPFKDATDAVTNETGLTIQKADLRLSKNGGNYAAAHSDQGEADAGAAHDELGDYDITLDTTDTNTLGNLRIAIEKTGALRVTREFTVLAANVYDSLIAASTSLKTDLETIKTKTVTCAAGVTVLASVGTAATSTAQTGDAYAATLTNSPMLLAAEIATVTSQTVFTLATGSDQDDAYNQHEIVLYDDSNSDYTCRRTVLDYEGASKTVTIDAAPNFTLEADDSVKIFVVPSSRIKVGV